MDDLRGTVMPRASYRLWLNDEKTIYVAFENDGEVVVATREDPSDMWSPPITLTEEDVR